MKKGQCAIANKLDEITIEIVKIREFAVEKENVDQMKIKDIADCRDKINNLKDEIEIIARHFTYL